MFKEGILDTILRFIRKLIPKRIFLFFQPAYHTTLAYLGAFVYGFPSRKLRVIGVTGTKGKSTTVYFITKLLNGAGHPVAAIGSLGYKIRDREWPNTLKMTMPGRFKLQKFLRQSVRAGCKYAVLEVTSEGIKQKRHLGVHFDCAVFTNLHREHLESHGSFESYLVAKQELFRRTCNIHVINVDDLHARDFGDFPARSKIFYGIHSGDMRASNITVRSDSAFFEIYGAPFSLHVGGEFNVYNALAALATVAMYGIDLPTAKPILADISHIPGRMDFIQREPFSVVVDYAHTPDSLEMVYKALIDEERKAKSGKLICVLGACGGGRDRWKRPEFGKIASKYCDEVILTNEDPYDEMPEKILDDIESGILGENENGKVKRILDRRKAIHCALTDAKKGDTVIITGKGSETSMALEGGEKIPWSDKEIVQKFQSLNNH